MKNVLELLVRKSVILNKPHMDSLQDTLNTLAHHRESQLLAREQQSLIRQQSHWFMSSNSNSNNIPPVSVSHSELVKSAPTIGATADVNNNSIQQKDEKFSSPSSSSSFVLSMPPLPQPPYNNNNNNNEKQPQQQQQDQPCVDELNVIEAMKCVISMVYQYYTQQLKQQQLLLHKESNAEWTVLLKQLNMSHVTLTQLVQENKVLTLLEIYKILSLEKYLFKQLLKSFVTSEYVYLFQDPSCNHNDNHNESPPVADLNNQHRNAVDTATSWVVNGNFVNIQPQQQHIYMSTDIVPVSAPPSSTMSFNNHNSPFVTAPTTTTAFSSATNNNNNNLIVSDSVNISPSLPVVPTSLEQLRPPPLVFNFPTNKVQKPTVTILSPPSEIQTTQSLSAMSSELKLTPLNIEVVTRYNNHRQRIQPVIIHDEIEHTGQSMSVTGPPPQTQMIDPMTVSPDPEQGQSEIPSFGLPPLIQALQHMNIDLDALTRNHYHTNPYFSLIAEYHYEDEDQSRRRRNKQIKSTRDGNDNTNTGVDHLDLSRGGSEGSGSDVSSSPVSRRSGQLSSEAESQSLQSQSDLFDCNDNN